MLDGMKGGGLVLGALVAALAVGGIAWFAMSMDGPVEPANKAAVVKARKNYLRLARSYQSGYLSESVRFDQRSLDRARRVPPPPADRARVRRMFALYDRSVSFGGPMISALERRDMPTFLRLARESDVPARQANRIATALGAAVCSRDLD
jgi:hypothetical protein